jgi:hypothetical protein
MAVERCELRGFFPETPVPPRNFLPAAAPKRRNGRRVAEGVQAGALYLSGRMGERAPLDSVRGDSFVFLD